MKFTVEVTATAELEVEAAYYWLSERTSIHAMDWSSGLREAIAGLSHFP